MLTYQEYRRLWYQELAQKTDTLYTTWVILPLAREVSYRLYRVRCHPNTVSLLAAALVLAGIGTILLVPDQLWAQVLAVVLLQISYILDYSDGAVARASGRTSAFGACLDLVLDRFNSMVVFFGILVADMIRGSTDASLPTVAIALVAFAGYFLFLLAVIIRKFVYPQERVVLRPWRSGRYRLLRYAISLPLDLLDTGVHYLLMTLSFLFGFVMPMLVLYGLLGWVFLIALLGFLYVRRPTTQVQ